MDRNEAMLQLIASVKAAGGTVHKGAEKRDYEPEAHGGVNRYLARKKANAKAEAKTAKAKAKFQKRNW